MLIIKRFLFLLLVSLSTFSYGQNRPVELNEIIPESENFLKVENDTEKIKDIFFNMIQETLYLRNVDYNILKSNKAVSVCLPTKKIRKDFFNRGLFEAIGYSTEEINENIAINKAYNSCEKIRIQNGLTNICECNTAFVNSNFILDLEEKKEIKFLLEEYIINNKETKLDISDNKLIDEIQIDDIPNDFNKWFGSISTDEGGLGWLMWDGTNYDTVKNIIDSTLVSTSSQATTELTKKILLSRSKSPKRISTDNNLKAVAHDGEVLESVKEDNFELLYKKIIILSKLGLTNEINTLMENIPVGIKPKGFDKKIFNLRASNNDLINTCEKINKYLSLDAKNIINRKLFIVCQVLKNENEKALLSIELLENDIGEEDTFLSLAKLLFNSNNDEKDKILNFAIDIEKSLIVGLSAAFRNKYLLQSLDEIDLNAVNKLIAYYKIGSVKDIILAAEISVGLRMLEPVYLAEIYASAFPKKNENFNITEEELKTNGPIIRAKLFVLSTLSTSSVERARYLSLLWEKGNQKGVLETVVFASILIALTLEPAEELSWFSLPMTKALIITSKYKLANKWLTLKVENTKLSYVDIGEVYGLMMLLIIVGEDLPDPYNVINVTDIWEDISNSNIVKENNYGKLLVIMDALGIKIPQGRWLGLIKKEENFYNVNISNAALRYQLREAVEGKRSGEVVMLSLLMLSNGTKKTNYLDLYEVIRSLRLVGLQPEAKKVAIEASLSLIN